MQGLAPLNGSYDAPEALPEHSILGETDCASSPRELSLHAVHVPNAHCQGSIAWLAV